MEEETNCLKKLEKYTKRTVLPPNSSKYMKKHIEEQYVETRGSVIGTYEEVDI